MLHCAVLIGTPGSLCNPIEAASCDCSVWSENNIIYQFFSSSGYIYINKSKNDPRYYISGAGGAIGGHRHPTFIVWMVLPLYVCTWSVYKCAVCREEGIAKSRTTLRGGHEIAQHINGEEGARNHGCIPSLDLRPTPSHRKWLRSKSSMTLKCHLAPLA